MLNYLAKLYSEIDLSMLPQNMASLRHQQRHMFHCWTTTWLSVVFQQKIPTSGSPKLFPRFSNRMIQNLRAHFSRA